MKERNEIMRFFGLHPQNDVRRKFAFTLAEGATHVGNSKNKRKFAFTLAEVLVTLGIIGVVAVLTVPNVISSYQKKVYVAQLQKAYNQLQQVFSLAMAEDEVEYLADTELMQSINGVFIGESLDQSAFSSKLGEYMKMQKVCQPLDFNDGCHDIMYDSFDFVAKTNRGGDLQVFTKDGMIFFFHSRFAKIPYVLSEELCSQIKADGGTFCISHTEPMAMADAGLEIDVNGKKKPNKYGRDLFRFHVDDKGQVYPHGSPIILGVNQSYLGGYTADMQCGMAGSYGIHCAAKIMDDGWKMDY